jgi:hypothetical protein
MERAMSNDEFGIDPQLWKSLTPAQQGAQMWLLVRRAHAARNRAVGQALLSAMGGLFSRMSRAVPAAAVPAVARCRRRPRPAQRGKDF